MYQFIDENGTFELEEPQDNSYLYFPLAGEQGIKSSITPNLGGDCKLDQNHFLLQPVSSEDLHNNKGTRNFWCSVEGSGVYSLTGESASQEANRFEKSEKTTLTAGLLWHKLTKEFDVAGIHSEILSFVPIGNEQVEIMAVAITNTSQNAKKLRPVAAIPVFGRSADNIRDHHYVTSLLNRTTTILEGVLLKPSLSFDERGHQLNKETYYVLGMEDEKIYSKGIYIVLIIGAIFILCASILGHNRIRESTTTTLVTEVTPVTVEQNSDDTRTMTFSYENFPYGGNYLAFYTSHQTVEVWMDRTCVYSLQPVPSFFGRTTGKNWNFVNIPPDAKQITVILTGIYKSTYDRDVIFIYGTGINLYRYVIMESLLPTLISIFNFLIGIIILIYWFATSRKEGNNRVLLYLGLFSSIVGLWSFIETPFAVLLISNRVASSSAAFIILSLAPVPFLLFVRELLQLQDKWIWKVIAAYSYITFFVMIALQIVGIADLKETVILTHICIAMISLYTIMSMFIKIKHTGFTHVIRVHIVSLFFIILAIVLDIVTYYTESVSVDTFGRIGLLIYILIMGANTARDTAKNIEAGRKAEYYRELAKKDILTGLLNRNAYITDYKKLVNKENILLVTFDLNDLKRANDMFGHAAGDQYLKDSSALISSVFQSYGACYRIGGDEFCALILDGSSCNPDELEGKLAELAEQHNQTIPAEGIPIKIAQGHAYYNPDTDEGLEDTMRRADAAMYEKKIKMKEE